MDVDVNIVLEHSEIWRGVECQDSIDYQIIWIKYNTGFARD